MGKRALEISKKYTNFFWWLMIKIYCPVIVIGALMVTIFYSPKGFFTWLGVCAIIGGTPLIGAIVMSFVTLFNEPPQKNKTVHEKKSIKEHSLEILSALGFFIVCGLIAAVIVAVFDVCFQVKFDEMRHFLVIMDTVFGIGLISWLFQRKKVS